MARRLYKRLGAAELKKRATQPGMHPDGDGLYLQVTPALVASWVFRYLAIGGGHIRNMGLGPLRRLGLVEARRLADEARRLRRDGVDPIEARRAQELDRRLKTVKTMTFKECARAYIAAHQAGWKNPVHIRQWSTTIETYAYPVFGNLSVAAVDTALVMQVLEPIWNSKTETANRLRGRIESILGWAATKGHRTGDNPARWKDHLENLLPKPSRTKEVARQAAGRGEHHAALPYVEVGGLVADLRREDSVAARALEFTILAAGRTSEVIGARWSEINLAERLWVVPAERIKAGKEHRVPLSDRMLAILDQMAALRDGEDSLIFPGIAPGRPLGSTAMLDLLRRLRHHGLTVHGFRSTFRDWAAERTSFPAEVAEMALAHKVGSAVQRAYQRSDMFERRRQLTTAWSDYCDQPAAPAAARGKVIAIGVR